MSVVPAATNSLLAARVATAVSAVAAPVAHAWLLGFGGSPVWPTLMALALGVLTRAVAPTALSPLFVLLAVAPIWQALVATVADGADVQWLMPWLAALAGWLAWPPGAPWCVTGPWRIAAAMWALVVALTWPVTAFRELDFTFQTIHSFTANGAMGANPPVAAAFVAMAAEAQLVALLLFDWAWGASAPNRRRCWLALAPGLGAACLIAIWQLGVDASFLSRQPWIRLHRAAGTLFDANAMGGVATLLGLGLAAHAAQLPGRLQALWSGGWLAIALAATVASGSRTSLAGFACGAVVLLVAARGWRWAALAAGLVLAAAFAWVGLAPAEGMSGDAAGRLAGTVRRVMADGAEGWWRVAWTRDGYGPVAHTIIRDFPWFGVGPGMFGGVVTDYARQGVYGWLPPDNAQNWWRHQWAELGLVGAAGAFASSLLALAAVWRSWRTGAGARTAPLVALGLMSVVSPPTQHPILQVLIGLLVAQAVVTREPAAVPVRQVATARGVPALTWAMALGCAAGLAIEGWTVFRPPLRASRFRFRYDYGVSALAETPYGEGRWAARRSVVVVPPEGRVLVARVVLPHDDLAAAPVTVTVSEGTRTVCRQLARDHTPFECRVPMPEGRWPIVRVAIGRGWRTEAGVEQAAVVSGRFEP